MMNPVGNHVIITDNVRTRIEGTKCVSGPRGCAAATMYAFSTDQAIH